MIKRMVIAGMGPHSEFQGDFNPRGVTVVAGPSEIGKTTILEAVLFALQGRSSTGRFPPEFIREGFSKAEVEMTLDSGRTIRRTITPTRSMTRTITLGGNKQSYSSEKAFQEALGDLGQDQEAIRLVLQPMAWAPMVAGNARAFRDALARMLPPGDVHGEIQHLMRQAGFEPEPAELDLNEKQVLALRRDARKERDQATGRGQAADERIASLQAQDADPEVSADQLAEAREVLGRFKVWDDYGRANQSAQARVSALQRLSEWQEKRAELGEEPAYVAGSYEKRVKEEKSARAALKAAMNGYTTLDARLSVEQEKLKEMMLAGGDVCPTCQRPGWDDGSDAMTDQEERVAALKAEIDAALATGKAARTRHNAAKNAVTEAQEAKAAWDAWRAGDRALGAEPTVPEEAATGDTPDVECPTDEQVSEARRIEDRYKASLGAREQRARDLVQAQEAKAGAEARVAELEAKIQRLEALLDAVRAAPSAVAHRQARALGDLGPVSLEFGENPAVEVRVDGRPWWLASRGRQVVADTWLRAGLRRALGLPYLPIIVDNVQDVGGQEVPLVGGPMILLKTTDGSSLTVTRKR